MGQAARFRPPPWQISAGRCRALWLPRESMQSDCVSSSKLNLHRGSGTLGQAMPGLWKGNSVIKIRDFSCGNGINCPALRRRENRPLIVSGPTVTDPQLLAELGLPDYEAAIEVPEEMFSGHGLTLIDIEGLAEYIGQRHTRDLFRLETLSYYDVGSDGEDYHRYLRGEPTPNAQAKQPWLDHLRADIAAGRHWRRVHALTTPLTDYVRYECEWAYTFNVAGGEDVRIIDDAGAPLMGVGDFFVIDHEHVVRSHYDGGGRFLGAEVVAEVSAKAPYIALADAIWPTAHPFTDWWKRHPEYHRSTRAA